MQILGIDIGGSGIKGAIVDTKTGKLLTERHRIPTPQPSTPESVGDTVAELTRHFNWAGTMGCTFPAIMKDGVARTATNVHPNWVGTDAKALFQEKTNLPVTVLNDADAAGLAEMTFGAGKKEKGMVLMLTLGTGIGSGLFYKKQLIPNIELGHLELMGHIPVERWAASSARKKEDLDWEVWAKRVSAFLQHAELLFSPDLFIIGGGVSNARKRGLWMHFLQCKTPFVPAHFGNNAGLIGAAMAAQKAPKKDD